jgi:hypothetical protein
LFDGHWWLFLFFLGRRRFYLFLGGFFLLRFLFRLFVLIWDFSDKLLRRLILVVAVADVPKTARARLELLGARLSRPGGLQLRASLRSLLAGASHWLGWTRHGQALLLLFL